MSKRIPRVREVMKRELGVLIERMIQFKASLVTISEVDLTPDLRKCHVYVSVFGNAEEKHDAITQLLDKRTDLQKALAKRITIKNTPRLHFHLDDSLDRGNRVFAILHEIGLSGPAENEKHPDALHEEDEDDEEEDFYDSRYSEDEDDEDEDDDEDDFSEDREMDDSLDDNADYEEE